MAAVQEKAGIRQKKTKLFRRAQVIYGTDTVNLPLLPSGPDGVRKHCLA